MEPTDSAPDPRSQRTEEQGARRESRPAVVQRPPELTPVQVAEREVANGLRQFDRVVELISAFLAQPPGTTVRLRPSAVMDLNRLAVDGLVPRPGSYRDGPIEILGGSFHTPPPHVEVPRLVEEMCDYVTEKWTTSSALHLSAFLQWRLNWIHPFADGNGRTSRAVAYYVLCAKMGYRLPGKKTIPERIAENKRAYYKALDRADSAWKKNLVDVGDMETLISTLLADQLLDVFHAAAGRKEAEPQAVPSSGVSGWGGLD